MTTSESSDAEGRGALLAARAIAVVRGGRRILDGASLELERSQMSTLEGPSGSGKSTLLRVLAGLVEPDEGEVVLSGVSARTFSPEVYRTKVAYVAQTPQMLEGTVADEVRAGPRFRGIELGADRVRDLLARVALDPTMAGRSSRDLSGGERVRVAMARALANEPEVLLLDEPTAPLDPETAGRVIDLLKALAREGASLVVVTHAVEHAEALEGVRWVCAAGVVSRKAS